MAVKLRLKRIGAKNKPFYRIVAADSRCARDGKVIEELGYYNPLSNPKKVEINKEAVMKWLKNGATLTDTARDLFRKQGIIKEFAEIKSSSKKTPKKEKKVVVKEEAPKVEKKPVTKKTTEPKAVKKTTTKKATTTKTVKKAK